MSDTSNEMVGKWMTAYRVPTSGKTCQWDIRAVNESLLGRIIWSTRWRRYVFTPCARTMFDAECLIALADFCKAHHYTRNAA